MHASQMQQVHERADARRPLQMDEIMDGENDDEYLGNSGSGAGSEPMETARGVGMDAVAQDSMQQEDGNDAPTWSETNAGRGRKRPRGRNSKGGGKRQAEARGQRAAGGAD